MSNEAKHPPFKKGDMACLILRVTEFQPSLSTEEDNSRVIFDCTDIAGISTEYSFKHDVIFAATRHLHPAPREGEYAITAAELRDICELYAAACVAIPWFGDEEAQLEWAKSRLHDLKQRKEVKP